MGTSAYLLRKSAPASGAYRDSRSRWGNSAELSVPTSSFVDGAGNGTSARPRRGRAPASGALRRLRLLATNASRLFYARTLSGSSPGTW